MADASHEASSSTVKPVNDPESTIEINIKTLDSQVHKLRVQKNVRNCLAILAFLFFVLDSMLISFSYRLRKAMFLCSMFLEELTATSSGACFSPKREDS